jgi:hypothetical protein
MSDTNMIISKPHIGTYKGANKCPGMSRVNDYRSWFTPKGLSTITCTYCEECYNLYVKDTNIDNGFTTNNRLTSCCCDYFTMNRNLGSFKDSIQVIIIDSTTKQVFPKAPNDGNRYDSVDEFILPTTTNYSVRIQLSEPDKYTFTVSDMYINDKKVNIINNENIRCAGTMIINQFEEGSTEFFKFISLSSKERKYIHSSFFDTIKITVKRWTIDSPGTERPYVNTFIEIPFTLQLICKQSDADKLVANKEFVNTSESNMRDQLLARKSVIGFELGKHYLNVKTRDDTIMNLKHEITLLENKIMLLEYVSSSYHVDKDFDPNVDKDSLKADLKSKESKLVVEENLKMYNGSRDKLLNDELVIIESSLANYAHLM